MAWALDEGAEADASAESLATNGGTAEALSWAMAYDEYGHAISATVARANGDAYASSTVFTAAGEDSIAQAYMNTNADATHSAEAVAIGVMTASADPSGGQTNAWVLKMAATNSAKAKATAEVNAMSYTNAGGTPAAGIVIMGADVFATGYHSLAIETIDADARSSHHSPDYVNIVVNDYVQGIGHAAADVSAWANHLYAMR